MWNYARNGAENTIVKIGALLLSQSGFFGGAQFSTFWDGNSLEDDGTKTEPVFARIYLSQKDVLA